MLDIKSFITVEGISFPFDFLFIGFIVWLLLSALFMTISREFPFLLCEVRLFLKNLNNIFTFCENFNDKEASDLQSLLILHESIY